MTRPVGISTPAGVRRLAAADLPIRIGKGAVDLWATMSDGDARRARMALEVAVLSMAEEVTRREGRGPSDPAGGALGPRYSLLVTSPSGPGRS